MLYDAMIEHTWAKQFLPQHLMEQFDTLPLPCRHIELCVKEFNSKLFLDKMTAMRTEIIFPKYTCMAFVYA